MEIAKEKRREAEPTGASSPDQGLLSEVRQRIERIDTRWKARYTLLPQGDELPASSQYLRGGTRSYRELPLRLAEYGTCYRYEQSGELFGLMRVRSMQMNDAHIYCTEEQFEDEFNAVNRCI